MILSFCFRTPAIIKTYRHTVLLVDLCNICLASFFPLKMVITWCNLVASSLTKKSVCLSIIFVPSIHKSLLLHIIIQEERDIFTSFFFLLPSLWLIRLCLNVFFPFNVPTFFYLQIRIFMGIERIHHFSLNTFFLSLPLGLVLGWPKTKKIASFWSPCLNNNSFPKPCFSLISVLEMELTLKYLIENENLRQALSSH